MLSPRHPFHPASTHLLQLITVCFDQHPHYFIQHRAFLDFVVICGFRKVRQNAATELNSLYNKVLCGTNLHIFLHAPRVALKCDTAKCK